jgi:tripartite-type tricarboxylate transporter receptor subunit TctC
LQAIGVEHDQGAGGAVAAAAVQNASPDGYTLLVFSGSQHAAVPAVQSAPYDPIKGFQPITLLFNLAALVAVPVTSPANTVAELLEYGKQKPGGLLFGSPGVGTPPICSQPRSATRPRPRCNTCTTAAAHR